MDVTQLVMTLYVFILAIFVGFELISKVPPTLHTPLMSGSNAISGITLLGALLVAGRQASGWQDVKVFLGFAAIAFAAINIVGGYVVTDRMLQMFKKKEKK
ncbi:MAG: NAD(P) transhydrogenase subunit alpha [Candidatus Hydrogenedentota bacterium]|nr:MAG: NAD(P) transhydrogenase subunit alpha [Candidatus Hydrogenedentota bacterium]